MSETTFSAAARPDGWTQQDEDDSIADAQEALAEIQRGQSANWTDIVRTELIHNLQRMGSPYAGERIDAVDQINVLRCHIGLGWNDLLIAPVDDITEDPDEPLWRVR